MSTHIFTLDEPFPAPSTPTTRELTTLANRLLTLAVSARGMHRGQRLGAELLAAVDRLEHAAEICALEESGHRVNASEPGRRS